MSIQNWHSIRLKQVLLLSLLIVAAFIFRLPGLSEPAYVDDEYFSITIGRSIRNGAVLFRDISDLHLGKPPLVFLIAALFPTQTSFRLIATFFYTAGLVALFKFNLKLLGSLKTAFLSCVAFILLTSTPLMGGLTPYNEIFLIPFPLLGLIFLLDSNSRSLSFTNSRLRLILSGLMFGLGLLIKVHAFFDISAVMLVMFVSGLNSPSPKTKIKDILIVIGTIFFLLAASTLALILWGVSLERLLELFKLGIMYSRNYRNDSPSLFILDPYSFYFKVVFIFPWICAVFVFWKKYSLKIWLLSTWLVFTLIGSVLLGAVGLHYTLVIVPALIISFCLLASSSLRTSVPVVVSIYIVFLFHLFYTWYYADFSYIKKYYQIYEAHVSGRISFNYYATFFSDYVPRNYAVANYLKSRLKPDEKIYIWGNATEIYSLTDTLPFSRYIWNEHVNWINDYSRTLDELETYKPVYVITFSELPQKGEAPLLEYINKNYVFEKEFVSRNDERALVYRLK